MTSTVGPGQCLITTLFASPLSGERVLCFHGPLLYEAKVCYNMFILFITIHAHQVMDSVISCYFLFLQCVKINIKDKLIKYFIHYSGWNKK